MHPILAIVGRPNVGKSRLFNRIVGSREAIVADVPGVTRDRNYAEAEWSGREFIVVDTGGLEFDAGLGMGLHVTRQSIAAMDEADVVVCLFDGQTEPTPEDRDVVARLRKIKKPVIFAVNKVDGDSHSSMPDAFYELGIGRPMPISAEHGIGVDDLLDEAMRHFPVPAQEAAPEEPDLAVAVVGRPNVGKSTLVNRLAGSERVIAHEMPGTTRDAVDVELSFDGKDYLFIDTAGMRRKTAAGGEIEKYTELRSLKAIDRAKAVLLLIDGAEGITKQDLSLLSFIWEQGKLTLLLVNKWDRVEIEWKDYERSLKAALGELAEVPMACISAKDGKNCLRIFSELSRLNAAMSRKIQTSELNVIVEEALASHHLPVYRGKQVKIYYATQVGTYPPTFALFANYPAAVPYAYRRYLKKRISEAMKFAGVPVKVVCRKK